jgi:hypothetical protein
MLREKDHAKNVDRERINRAILRELQHSLYSSGEDSERGALYANRESRKLRGR